jgi:hypothetical protein
MLVNINDITLDNETLAKYIKALESPKSYKNKVKDENLLLIDWKDVDVNKINFDSLSKNLVNEFFQNYGISDFKSLELFRKVFHKIKEENEETLWCYLVDSHLISNEVYMNNTYDENIDLLFKNRNNN